MDISRPKCLTLGILLGAFMYKIWLRFRGKLFLSSGKGPLQDCLFFTPKKIICDAKCFHSNEVYNQMKSLIPCNSCSLRDLLSVLNKAKRNLDICMYLITSEEICDVILRLFKRGVHVRLIADKQMSTDAFGTKILIFRREYIPLKVIESSNMMHNKFAIVDREVVITGSANWTRQGFTGNYENILILYNSYVAQKYTEYFELLWNIEEN